MSQCLIYFIINKTFVSDILAYKALIYKTRINVSQL